MAVFNERAQMRQVLVNNWFKRFVEGQAYTQDEYHAFCIDVKMMSNSEIIAYYNTLV
jgi:hypothetical protein